MHSRKHISPFFGFFIAALLYAAPVHAEPVHAEPVAINSMLFPPSGLERYSGRNEPDDVWLISQHGIRNGPLHPITWGTRKDQRTESHRIISIKRYYLRSSENPNYRIDRLKLFFSFWKASKTDMEFRAQEKDPVIEFEFGGKVVLGLGGELASIDRGYDLRLSAFPGVPAGLFFRSHLLSTLLSPLKVPALKTGKKNQYLIEGSFTDSEARFTLNGTPLAETTAPRINAGLVSIITGWSPATVFQLEIDGHLEGTGGKTPLHESGLVLLQRKGGAVKAPALTDNKVLDKALLRPVEAEAEQ